MLVLGVDVYCHDGAVCLVRDGEVGVAVSEERLSREKHCRGWRRALDYCLEAAGVDISEVDLLCVTHPYLNDAQAQLTVPTFQVRGRTFALGYDLRFVDHYRCHAASAFYTSGFDQSLVFVIDGHGSDGTELVTQGFYRAGPCGLERLYTRPNRVPSLDVGFAFESVSYHLGFENEEFDAGKTMGLSAYGEYLAGSREPLYEIAGNHIRVNPRYIRYHDVVRGTTRRVRELGPRREPDQPFTQLHLDCAAFFQNESERIVLEKVAAVSKDHPSRRLCVAGGVAMNGLVVNRLRESLGFDDVFVPPMANDAGTAVGAALLGHAQLAGRAHTTRDAITSSAWGRSYPAPPIAAIQGQHTGVNAKQISDHQELIDAVAEALASGAVVGWMQGRSEFGPRALGHRSILCDPRSMLMKDVVNARVKKREAFRPFAPAVLWEHTRRYFHFDAPSRFMCFIASATARAGREVPAVVHEDGTARLQTVHAETDGLFYDLLRAFYGRTNVPVLLNTSFNLAGEPIVETPEDALETFFHSGIDLVVIGDTLICKRKAWDKLTDGGVPGSRTWSRIQGSRVPSLVITEGGIGSVGSGLSRLRGGRASTGRVRSRGRGRRPVRRPCRLGPG